jgi:hypothetical protein
MACPLCDYEQLNQNQMSPVGNKAATWFNCPICGPFIVYSTVLNRKILREDPIIKERRYLLSALARTTQTCPEIDLDRIKKLKDGIPSDRTITEKIDLVLRSFAERSKEIGQAIAFNRRTEYPTAWCRSPDEWQQIVAHLGTRRLLELGNTGPGQATATVTIEGWQWLGERPKVTGHQGFIAMSFDPSLEKVSEAIHEGIRQAGYEPYRVKEDHYIGGVMDQIIARIRESLFVVADLTNNRGGVYYEAGFAEGIGLPVFLLCEGKQLDPKDPERVHFDVAHLSILPWKKDALPELTSQLRDRIMRVMGGRGPFVTGA